MPTDKHRKMLITAGVVALALALPLALAVVGGMKMWEESRAPQFAPEHTAALREAAERAADAVLPTPTLGAGALVVECPAERFESELQRVVRLAKGLGGAASSWNDGESVRIVANVPSSAEKLFRDAVHGGMYDLNAAGETKQMTVVEVLLRTSSPATSPPAKKSRAPD